MRATGHYWVKLKRVNSEWEVGFYNSVGWQLTGLTAMYNERDFQEIDENRIVRDYAVNKFIGDIAKVTGDSPEQVIKTLREHYNG